jgi:protein-L-isoaspartate(D-aspartate) O-methyltransferase
MNIEQARFNMIEQQIRPWNVLEQDVLSLLSLVKRENFVPSVYKNLAFVDTEIPLPNNECMLAPKVEARLLQSVAVKKHEQVLEIGTGSGYMAALLAHKGRYVTTVEIDPDIKAMAEKNLMQNGVTNVSVALGNGAQGWAHGMEPYDVIVISGALPVLPNEFLQQLKVGGRLAAIIGSAPVMTAQLITRISDSSFHTEKLFETQTRVLREANTPSTFTF